MPHGNCKFVIPMDADASGPHNPYLSDAPDRIKPPSGCGKSPNQPAYSAISLEVLKTATQLFAEIYNINQDQSLEGVKIAYFWLAFL